MKKFWILAILLMAVIPCTTNANTVYDSLGLDPSSNYPDVATTDKWWGQLFYTDSNSYSLTSVTLLMQMLSESGKARVSIYDDNDGLPNSVVGTLISPGLYSKDLYETSFSGNGIELNPNSAYWVVLSAELGRFGWEYADQSCNKEKYALYKDNEWTNHEGSPLMMKVEASPVPEPTSLLLLGSGIGVLGLAAWRKRK